MRRDPGRRECGPDRAGLRYAGTRAARDAAGTATPAAASGLAAWFAAINPLCEKCPICSCRRRHVNLW